MKPRRALQKPSKSKEGLLGGVVRVWPTFGAGAGSQGNNTSAKGVVGSIVAAKGTSIIPLAQPLHSLTHSLKVSSHVPECAGV